MINEISHDENGLSVKWADESDIREIIRAYKTTFRSPGYVNFSFPTDYILKTFGNNFEYETLLRSKLFYYKEDFFILYVQDKIEGVLSIKNNLPDSYVMEIITLFAPQTLVPYLLNSVQQLLTLYYPFSISKIRIRSIDSENDSFKTIQPSLDEFGFQKVAVLNNEYRNGKDLIILDKAVDLQVDEV